MKSYRRRGFTPKAIGGLVIALCSTTSAQAICPFNKSLTIQDDIGVSQLPDGPFIMETGDTTTVTLQNVPPATTVNVETPAGPLALTNNGAAPATLTDSITFDGATGPQVVSEIDFTFNPVTGAAFAVAVQVNAVCVEAIAPVGGQQEVAAAADGFVQSAFLGLGENAFNAFGVPPANDLLQPPAADGLALAPTDAPAPNDPLAPQSAQPEESGLTRALRELDEFAERSGLSEEQRDALAQQVIDDFNQQEPQTPERIRRADKLADAFINNETFVVEDAADTAAFNQLSESLSTLEDPSDEDIRRLAEEAVRDALAEQPPTVGEADAPLTPEEGRRAFDERNRRFLAENSDQNTPESDQIRSLIEREQNLQRRIEEKKREIADLEAEAGAPLGENFLPVVELNTLERRSEQLREDINTAIQEAQSQAASRQALRDLLQENPDQNDPEANRIRSLIEREQELQRRIEEKKREIADLEAQAGAPLGENFLPVVELNTLERRSEQLRQEINRSLDSFEPSASGAGQQAAGAVSPARSVNVSPAPATFIAGGGSIGSAAPAPIGGALAAAPDAAAPPQTIRAVVERLLASKATGDQSAAFTEQGREQFFQDLRALFPEDQQNQATDFGLDAFSRLAKGDIGDAPPEIQEQVVSNLERRFNALLGGDDFRIGPFDEDGELDVELVRPLVRQAVTEAVRDIADAQREGGPSQGVKIGVANVALNARLEEILGEALPDASDETATLLSSETALGFEIAQSGAGLGAQADQQIQISDLTERILREAGLQNNQTRAERAQSAEALRQSQRRTRRILNSLTGQAADSGLAQFDPVPELTDAEIARLEDLVDRLRSGGAVTEDDLAFLRSLEARGEFTPGEVTRNLTLEEQAEQANDIARRLPKFQDGFLNDALVPIEDDKDRVIFDSIVEQLGEQDDPSRERIASIIRLAVQSVILTGRGGPSLEELARQLDELIRQAKEDRLALDETPPDAVEDLTEAERRELEALNRAGGGVDPMEPIESGAIEPGAPLSPFNPGFETGGAPGVSDGIAPISDIAPIDPLDPFAPERARLEDQAAKVIALKGEEIDQRTQTVVDAIIQEVRSLRPRGLISGGDAINNVAIGIIIDEQTNRPSTVNDDIIFSVNNVSPESLTPSARRAVIVALAVDRLERIEARANALASAFVENQAFVVGDAVDRDAFNELSGLLSQIGDPTADQISALAETAAENAEDRADQAAAGDPVSQSATPSDDGDENARLSPAILPVSLGENAVAFTFSLAGARPETGVLADPRLDVWARGRARWTDDDRGGLAQSETDLSLAAGARYRVAPQTAVGGALRYRRIETDGTFGDFDADAFAVAAFVQSAASGRVMLEGIATYEHGAVDAVFPGAGNADFDVNAVILEAAASRRFSFESAWIEPRAALVYAAARRDGFQTSGGVAVDDAVLDRGALEIGAEVGMAFDVSETALASLRPTLGATAVWNFIEPDDLVSAGGVASGPTAGVRLNGGVEAVLRNGASLSLEGSYAVYDGGDPNSLGAALTLTIPLN